MKTSVENRRRDPRCSPSSREQRVSDPAHRGLSLALYLAMAEHPATKPSAAASGGVPSLCVQSGVPQPRCSTGLPTPLDELARRRRVYVLTAR